MAMGKARAKLQVSRPRPVPARNALDQPQLPLVTAPKPRRDGVEPEQAAKVAIARRAEPGEWVVDYDWKKFPSMFDAENMPPSRFPMKCRRPPEHSPGITLAGRVVVPWYSPTIPDLTLDPKVAWLQTAPQSKAREFAII